MGDDLYLKNVGRETRLKELEQALRIEIKGLLEQLQSKADPLEEPERLDGNGIASAGIRVANLLNEHAGVRDDLAAVRRALGR